ncbi:MAG: hypothetical protein ACP5I4_02345 [Oceanipulchritudo sp.]
MSRFHATPFRIFLAICAGSFPLYGQEFLIDEPFDDLSGWDDLSTAISWTGQPVNGSAWETTGGILSLNEAGIASVGLTPWDSIGKTRSFTALDRQFSEPLTHRDGDLVIEIRVRWASMIYDLRGEWNRINLMLVHEYPAGGLDLTRDVKVYDFTQEWWGRPSYQVRIRGNDRALGDGEDGTALLMYGGGYSPEGEFEIYSDSLGPLWWLPGFSSTAGGDASNGGPSPGVGDPWPCNGWVRSSKGLASLQWQRFRYVVAPDHQALYVDADDDGMGWVRDGYMPLPEEAEAPGTAPLYRYFESHEGLRVYFRGYEDVEMDYLQAWFTPVTGRQLRLIREGNAWRLRFPTRTGEVYVIEHSSDLQTWLDLTPPIEGDGFEAVYDLGSLQSSPASFYRLRLE